MPRGGCTSQSCDPGSKPGGRGGGGAVLLGRAALQRSALAAAPPPPLCRRGQAPPSGSPPWGAAYGSVPVGPLAQTCIGMSGRCSLLQCPFLRIPGPGMYEKGGERGGGVKGRGGLAGPPPPPRVPLWYPLKAGRKFCKRESSWHRRHRSRNFGRQPQTLEGEGARGVFFWGVHPPPPPDDHLPGTDQAVREDAMGRSCILDAPPPPPAGGCPQ